MTKRNKIIPDINSHSALSQDVALVFHWTNKRKKKSPFGKLVNWTRLTLPSWAGEAEGLRRDWERRLFRLIKKERQPCWYLLRTPTCESRSKGWNYSCFLRDEKIQRAWKILNLTELFLILQSICIRTRSCLTWIWHASLADRTTRVTQARDAGLVVVSSHLVMWKQIMNDKKCNIHSVMNSYRHVTLTSAGRKNPEVQLSQLTPTVLSRHLTQTPPPLLSPWMSRLSDRSATVWLKKHSSAFPWQLHPVSTHDTLSSLFCFNLSLPPHKSFKTSLQSRFKATAPSVSTTYGPEGMFYQRIPKTFYL